MLKLLNRKFSTAKFYFKPRKIVAQYKLFLGDEWLELSVNSIAPYVYKILFVISNIPWGNDDSIKGDDLKPIIAKLIQKYGDKIIVYNGSWNKQLNHVQAGLDYIKENIPEASHCLYIDGDEIYKEKQIKRLTRLTKRFNFYNKAIRINYNTYFKSIYYKIVPEKWPTALVLFPIRSYMYYYTARNVSARNVDLRNYFYEHLAYVRKNDDSIGRKISAHKETEAILGNWYNDIWLKWNPELENFHPTSPDMWERIEEVSPESLPDGVEETYKRWY